VEALLGDEEDGVAVGVVLRLGLLQHLIAGIKSTSCVLLSYFQVREPRTPFVLKGPTLRKAWRSLGSPTPDAAPWGYSPDLPGWRTGDGNTREAGSCPRVRHSPTLF
jgi:hypothetical protein